MNDQTVIWEEHGHPPEPKRGGRVAEKYRGYPSHPGTGPENETCRTCKFKTKRVGVAGNFLKCKLMKEIWTGGPGTDIKANSPACRYWKGKEK